MRAFSGQDNLTVHGFRDWCAEMTSYPGDVAEAALAHTLRDKVEAAFRRGDMLERRAKMMAEGAAFLARPPDASAVVSIRGRRRA